MILHQIHRKQELPISVERAWRFLSDPQNLGSITPPEMQFQIINGGNQSMYAGQIIQYIIRPFPGISLRWVTEITHCKEEHYFVDEQRIGPYKIWHHKHFIRPVSSGVEMEDIVHYKLPLGWLGNLLHRLFIRRQLEDIFNFRAEKLASLFANKSGS